VILPQKTLTTLLPELTAITSGWKLNSGKITPGSILGIMMGTIMKRIELDKMDTDDLWSLHMEVTELLQQRIKAEKLRLEERLKQLQAPVSGRRPYPAPMGRDADDMCLAIPGQIVEVVDDDRRLARVDVAGVRRNVNIGLLDADDGGVGPGDWVLIHVGFAISQVDEDEARATRRMLERMGEDYERELEELKASVIE